MKKTVRSNSAGTAAYHEGPPEIDFAGRRWTLGSEQPINRAEFDALQARPDAAPFAFTFTEEK